MKTILICAAVSLVGARLSAADIDWSKLPPVATNANVTFAADIEPIFKASCVRCHSGERAKDKLRLDSLEGVLNGTRQGPVLTPGDSANSLLVKAVSQLDPKIAMPPKPHGRRGHRPGEEMQGTNAPAMPPGGPGNGGPPQMGGDDDHGPGGPPPGEGGPGMAPRHFGPPPKPLTAEQVGLIRAWINQGAK